MLLAHEKTENLNVISQIGNTLHIFDTEENKLDQSKKEAPHKSETFEPNLTSPFEKSNLNFMESQISLIFDPTIKLSGLDIMIRRYLDIRTIQDDLDITSIGPYLDIRNTLQDLDITTILPDLERKERKNNLCIN